MNVFVSEYLCSGALSATELPESLNREGAAMLWAVVDDLRRLPGCRVAITLDSRLFDSTLARGFDTCLVEPISSAHEERSAFDRLVNTCDATLVIAPETDGVLARRVRRVLDLGGGSLNCSPAAIELCGDKLRLAQHLTAHNIPTIPTRLFDFGRDEIPREHGPSWVLKPRDGAGSWLTFFIPQADRDAWDRARCEFVAARAADRVLLQPFIRGQPLSVGCVCHSEGLIEVLPVGLQHISIGRFEYQGGTIPAHLSDKTRSACVNLVQRACATIPGLSGYIGLDLLVPDADPSAPIIVEINPRLTTSYVGYRRLCRENLAKRLLHLNRKEHHLNEPSPPLNWKTGTVRFDSGGSCVSAT